MTIRALTSADVKVMPWANGRGVTRELLRRETADRRMICRLSVADVVEPGAFSPLPGIDRVLTLVEGAGFGLTIDTKTVTIAPFEPVCFSGDDAVAAVEVAGPSRDFNVMVDREIARADVVVHKGTFVDVATEMTYYYVAEGDYLVSGVSPDLIGRKSLIAVEKVPGKETEFQGSGIVIVVHVTLNQPFSA